VPPSVVPKKSRRFTTLVYGEANEAVHQMRFTPYSSNVGSAEMIPSL
jgi:hypothetical protein